ncbi:hypothetical protein GmHk_18G050872 [Glycine max]|nr:hypothetical protein GmHk_18G050872 [Glycine max]
MVEIDAETIIEMEVVVLGLIGVIIMEIVLVHTESLDIERFMYYELWAEGLIISVGWFLKLEAKRGKWIVSQLLAAKQASYWSSHFTVAFLCLLSAMLVCLHDKMRIVALLVCFMVHTSSPMWLLHIQYHLRAELSSFGYLWCEKYGSFLPGLSPDGFWRAYNSTNVSVRYLLVVNALLSNIGQSLRRREL